MTAGVNAGSWPEYCPGRFCGCLMVSVDGHNWARHSNWSYDYDNAGLSVTKSLPGSPAHNLGRAQGSGDSAGGYTSYNSSQVTVFRARLSESPSQALAIERVNRTVRVGGLPKPVFCNQTAGHHDPISGSGIAADCFWDNMASIKMADGSLRMLTVGLWFGGLFGAHADSSGVFCFTSRNSYTWDYLGTVARAADYPESCEGPNENSLSHLAGR